MAPLEEEKGSNMSSSRARSIRLASTGIGSAALLLMLAAPGSGAHQSEQSIARPVYVVSAQDGGRDGSVLAIDGETGAIRLEFRADTPMNRPDFALSPNGTRLYVSYNVISDNGNRDDGWLEVFDTRTGLSTVKVPNPERWLSTLPLYTSHMSVSTNGRWLFQQKTRLVGSPGAYHSEYYIDTFDTIAGRFLPKSVPIPECASAMLVPHPVANNSLMAMCSHTQDIRHITILADGSQSPDSKGKVRLRERPRADHPGVAFFAAEGASATAILGDAQYVVADVKSTTVTKRGVVDGIARRASLRVDGRVSVGAADRDWMTDRQIREQRPVVAPNGSTVVVGVSSSQATGHGWLFFRELAVLNANGLERVRSITLPGPSWAIALSKDGNRIYATNPDSACIYVLTPEDGRLLKTLYLPSTFPIMVLPG